MDNDRFQRALEATQREQRLEQRIGDQVMKRVSQALESGFVISRVHAELDALMRDSQTLHALRGAIHKLERQQGFEGLEQRLVELMGGEPEEVGTPAQTDAVGTETDRDPGSAPPSEVPT